MKSIATKIPSETKYSEISSDLKGWFTESYSQVEYRPFGIKADFIQGLNLIYILSMRKLYE